MYGKYNVGVSENCGTPKSSILIGFSIINHPIWGIPIFGNTHVYIVDGSFTTLWCVTEMLSLIVPHYSLKNLYRNKWTVSAGCYSNWFPQKMVVEHFKTVHHRSTSFMAIDSMNAVLTAAVVPLICR